MMDCVCVCLLVVLYSGKRRHDEEFPIVCVKIGTMRMGNKSALLAALVVSAFFSGSPRRKPSAVVYYVYHIREAWEFVNSFNNGYIHDANKSSGTNLPHSFLFARYKAKEIDSARKKIPGEGGTNITFADDRLIHIDSRRLLEDSVPSRTQTNPRRAKELPFRSFDALSRFLRLAKPPNRPEWKQSFPSHR